MPIKRTPQNQDKLRRMFPAPVGAYGAPPVEREPPPRKLDPNAIPFEAFMDPESHGYEMCPHCNGYGSSLQDPPGVDKCSQCGGVELRKKSEDK